MGLDFFFYCAASKSTKVNKYYIVLSVAAPFRPVSHMSWNFQWNIIVSLEFRSSLEVHLPIYRTGRSQCFVEPLGSLAGLEMMAANRRDSYSPSGLSGAAAAGAGGHSEPRTGLLSSTGNLQAKYQVLGPSLRLFPVCHSSHWLCHCVQSCVTTSTVLSYSTFSQDHICANL